MRFSPTLAESDIKTEAVRMVTRAMEARAQEEYKQALQKEKETLEQAQVSTAIIYSGLATCQHLMIHLIKIKQIHLIDTCLSAQDDQFCVLSLAFRGSY